MAVVSGKLQIRVWTDKDGNKRRTAEVIADNVYFADSKKESAGAPKETANSYGSAYVAPVNPPQSDFSLLEDDDAQLPF